MTRAFIQCESRATVAAATIALGICGPNLNSVERVSSGLDEAGTLAEIRADKFVTRFRTIVRAMGE
jgi:hypothetical protein